MHPLVGRDLLRRRQLGHVHGRRIAFHCPCRDAISCQTPSQTGSTALCRALLNRSARPASPPRGFRAHSTDPGGVVRESRPGGGGYFHGVTLPTCEGSKAGTVCGTTKCAGGSDGTTVAPACETTA